MHHTAKLTSTGMVSERIFDVKKECCLSKYCLHLFRHVFTYYPFHYASLIIDILFSVMGFVMLVTVRGLNKDFGRNGDGCFGNDCEHWDVTANSLYQLHKTKDMIRVNNRDNSFAHPFTSQTYDKMLISFPITLIP